MKYPTGEQLDIFVLPNGNMVKCQILVYDEEKCIGGMYRVMRSADEAINIYCMVTEDYEKGCIDQKQLAEKYGISEEAVRWCTQYYGYCHTKAKDGKNPLIESDRIEELRRLL